jgi:predicted TIM-barrel fold metal-dependent hydrolase
MFLLIHASDPDGPDYPGRDTTVPSKVIALLKIVGDVAPELNLVMAHLGGGLPFFADDADIRAQIERTHVVFDTAACAFMYAPSRLREAARKCPGRIVFGSDHPVSGIDRTLRWVREAELDPAHLG